MYIYTNMTITRVKIVNTFIKPRFPMPFVMLTPLFLCHHPLPQAKTYLSFEYFLFSGILYKQNDTPWTLLWIWLLSLTIIILRLNYVVWRLRCGDLGSIPGLERSPGGRDGNLLQCSCLENPHGQRSLTGYSPWGCKESDMTEQLNTCCIYQ